MPRRNDERRVLGPYEITPTQWRIIVVNPQDPDPKRRRTPETHESEDAAKRAIALYQKNWEKLLSVSIEKAIDAYKQFQIDNKVKEKSYEETERRLHLFFTSTPTLPDGTPRPIRIDLQFAVADLDEVICQSLYDDFRTRLVTKGKGANAKTNPISDDYQLNVLSQSKTFLGFCKDKGWNERNPMAEVEGIGKRNHGKQQLRIDEAVRWLDTAIDLAEGGDEGAVAAIMTLLMSNRASEVTERRVRDLDAGGTVLWLDEAKTEESEGMLEIPEVLQPFLRELCEGKSPEDYIFATDKGRTGRHWRDWPAENVRRICKLAGVREVCAHAMRGFSATIQARKGTAGDDIAATLRHRDKNTTLTSYATKSSVRFGNQKRLLDQLEAVKARTAA